MIGCYSWIYEFVICILCISYGIFCIYSILFISVSVCVLESPLIIYDIDDEDEEGTVFNYAGIVYI